MKQYKHLEITISPLNMKKIKLGIPPSINTPSFLALRRWMASIPLILKIAKAIVEYAKVLDSEKKTFKSIELLNSRGEGDAHDFDSIYGYEDDLQELKTAMKYAMQIQEGFKGQSESKQLYAHIETIFTDLFSHEEIKTFCNFGVSYAHIDSVLASKFSEIQFFGIDRSSLTKVYNESQFAYLGNLQFIAGDIFQFLDKNKFERGVFFHTRTLLLLPKVFVERLYKAIAKAKFKYIVCVEQIGVSRQTLQAYQFSEEDQPSVVYRDMMYIHNYPALLRNAGFLVERSELVETDHPHADLRLLSITAKRNQ